MILGLRISFAHLPTGKLQTSVVSPLHNGMDWYCSELTHYQPILMGFPDYPPTHSRAEGGDQGLTRLCTHLLRQARALKPPQA